MKKLLLLLTLMLGITSLGACGTTKSNDATTSASALPPHMANIKGQGFDGDVPVIMKVGEFYVFTGESTGWVVATQNPELVKVEQGGTKDTYETNPGFQAIAAGRAVVTITSPSNTILTIMVTIEN